MIGLTNQPGHAGKRESVDGKNLVFRYHAGALRLRERLDQEASGMGVIEGGPGTVGIEETIKVRSRAGGIKERRTNGQDGQQQVRKFGRVGLHGASKHFYYYGGLAGFAKFGHSFTPVFSTPDTKSACPGGPGFFPPQARKSACLGAPVFSTPSTQKARARGPRFFRYGRVESSVLDYTKIKNASGGMVADRSEANVDREH
jgi:hypothetical protein